MHQNRLSEWKQPPSNFIKSCSRVPCGRAGWARKRRKAGRCPLLPTPCFWSSSALCSFLNMDFKKIILKCFSLCSLLIVCRLQRLNAEDRGSISRREIGHFPGVTDLKIRICLWLPPYLLGSFHLWETGRWILPPAAYLLESLALNHNHCLLLHCHHGHCLSS